VKAGEAASFLCIIQDVMICRSLESLIVEAARGLDNAADQQH
jgi:hypothetical protein